MWKVCSRHRQKAKEQLRLRQKADDGWPLRRLSCPDEWESCPGRCQGRVPTRLTGAGLGCHCCRTVVIGRPSLGKKNVGIYVCAVKRREVRRSRSGSRCVRVVVERCREGAWQPCSVQPSCTLLFSYSAHNSPDYRTFVRHSASTDVLLFNLCNAAAGCQTTLKQHWRRTTR
jgi:hypothetical protein